MTQSEIEDLEGTLQKNARDDTSMIEGLLDKIPDGLLGGGSTGDKKNKMHEIQDNASNAQMEQSRISPREPEEFTRYVQDVFRSIMPAIEFHDELFMNISEAFDKVPILPKIIEQLEEQMSMWVFSIIAPMVVPILQQVKNELRTGSSEIIQSSQKEQHIVFSDDRCTDPTHSMLSKDHFTNVSITSRITCSSCAVLTNFCILDPERACWQDCRQGRCLGYSSAHGSLG